MLNNVFRVEPSLFRIENFSSARNEDWEEVGSEDSSMFLSFFRESIVNNIFLLSRGEVLRDEKNSFSSKDLYEYYIKTKKELVQNTTPNARVGVLFHPSATQAATILTIIASGRIPVIYSHWKTQKEIQLLSSRDNLEGMFTSNLNDSEDFHSDCSVWFVNREIEITKTRKSNRQLLEKRNLKPPMKGACLILFTSGSSGRPKAVSISARALIYSTSTLIDYLRLNEKTEAMITLPLFHTMALNTQFFPTLFAGGTCSVLTPELSVGSTYREIVGSKANFISTIADMIPILAKEKRVTATGDANEVKDIQLAGGVITKENLELTHKLFPNARIHKGYGQTELIRTTMISSEDPMFYSSTIGKALKGQRVEIRDERGCLPLAVGKVGKLFVQSPSQTLGYEGEDSFFRTAHDDFWETGDYASIDENGYVYFHGRKDSVFKSQGKKVSGLEIEKCALKTEIGSSLKCFAIKCERKGLKPILVIERNEDSEDFQEEINRFEEKLRSLLPTYKVPREVFFKNKFERLSNGKINMKKLETEIEENNFIRIGKTKMGMKFFMINEEKSL